MATALTYSSGKTRVGKIFYALQLGKAHSSVDDKTPDEFYFHSLPELPKAAYALTARFFS
jgi:hypothetical protein